MLTDSVNLVFDSLLGEVLLALFHCLYANILAYIMYLDEHNRKAATQQRTFGGLNVRVRTLAC